MLCAPTIFLPTTFLEYCTGTLLSACCINTTPATNIIAPIKSPNAVNNPVVLNPSEVIIKSFNVPTKLGKPEMIPTKIIIEIPFPIPLLLISSPSHISIDVPATNDITISVAVPKLVFTNTPEFL